jgi:hypothetical protein
LQGLYPSATRKISKEVRTDVDVNVNVSMEQRRHCFCAVGVALPARILNSSSPAANGFDKPANFLFRPPRRFYRDLVLACLADMQ